MKKYLLIFLVAILLVPFFSQAGYVSSNRSFLANIYCATIGYWFNSPSCKEPTTPIVPAIATIPASPSPSVQSNTPISNPIELDNSVIPEAVVQPEVVAPKIVAPKPAPVIIPIATTTPSYVDTVPLDIISGNFPPNSPVSHDFLSRQVSSIGDSTGRSMSNVSTAIGDRISSLTTSNIAEGSNLYYTDARVGAIGTTTSVSWTLRSDWALPTAGSEYLPVFVDIDNDGLLDLYVGGQGGSADRMYAYQNVGTKSVASWTRKAAWDIGVNGYSAHSIPKFGDLNGDGKKDAIWSSYYGADVGYFGVKKNSGTQKNPAWTTMNSWWPTGVQKMYTNGTFVDLNNDGLLDLVIYPVASAAYNVYVYQNTGTINSPVWTENSTWESSMSKETLFGGSWPGSDWISVDFADLDGDGLQDMIFVQNTYPSAVGAYIFRNLGSKTNPQFSRNAVWETGLPVDCVSASFGDIDGDGDSDLACGGWSGGRVYENTGAKGNTIFGTSYGTVQKVQVNSGGNLVLNDSMSIFSSGDLPSLLLRREGVGKILSLNGLVNGSSSELFSVLSSGNAGLGNISTDSRFTVAGMGTSTLTAFSVENSLFARLFTVLDSGNVGIGSSTPYAALSVTSATTSATTLALRPIASQTANILDMYTSAGVLTDVVSSQNKWGLGTTTPVAKLSLKQAVNTNLGGMWLAGTDGDYRAMYISDTSGTLSFNGGDLAGATNTATLNSAGAWTNASDIAYKENIIDLGTKYGLSAVLETSPRFYTMKGTGKPQVGFVAQELKLTIPEVVEGEDGSMGISYGNLVAVAFQAIKDLSTKIDDMIKDGLVTMKDLVLGSIEATVGKFGRVNTTTLDVENICADGVCISKDRLKALLIQAGAVASSSPVATSSIMLNYSVAPVVTPTSTISTTVHLQNVSLPMSSTTLTSMIATSTISTTTPQATSTEPIISPEVSSSTPEVIEQSDPITVPPAAVQQPSSPDPTPVVEIPIPVTEVVPVVEPISEPNPEPVQ